jgi:hypothetical protein
LERKRADDLAEELRLMEELRDEEAAAEPPTPTRASWGRTATAATNGDSLYDGEASAELVSRLRRELQARDDEVRSLRRQPSGNGRRVSHPPPNIDTTSNISPSLSPTRSKRDSTASSTSSRRSIGSEGSQMKEQIVGLKVIISQLTEENKSVTAQNKMLVQQAEELRFVWARA